VTGQAEGTQRLRSSTLNPNGGNLIGPCWTTINHDNGDPALLCHGDQTHAGVDHQGRPRHDQSIGAGQEGLGVGKNGTGDELAEKHDFWFHHPTTQVTPGCHKIDVRGNINVAVWPDLVVPDTFDKTRIVTTDLGFDS